MDFAKESFGGPSTTEQVEFFRFLLVLFAIGPVFALEVPASYFIAPYLACTFTIILYASKNIVVVGLYYNIWWKLPVGIHCTNNAGISCVVSDSIFTFEEVYIEAVHKTGYIY